MNIEETRKALADRRERECAEWMQRKPFHQWDRIADESEGVERYTLTMPEATKAHAVARDLVNLRDRSKGVICADIFLGDFGADSEIDHILPVGPVLYGPDATSHRRPKDRVGTRDEALALMEQKARKRLAWIQAQVAPPEPTA
jgi:hypothetical protein